MPVPLIPLAAGALSKTFLNVACKSFQVEGLPAFLERLQSERGIITGEVTNGSRTGKRSKVLTCSSRQSQITCLS